MANEAAELFAAANLAARAGRAQEALAGYDAAIAADPAFAAAYVNRAALLLAARDTAGALAAAQAAAEAFADFAPAHAVAGEAALAAGLPVRAEAALRRALALDAHAPGPRNNLALALQGQGRIADALEIYRSARAAAPHDPVLASNELMCAQYDPPDGDGLARARAWPGAVAHAVRPAAAPLDGRRLRVGYASPDFCSHSCSYFLVPLLAGHDRANVELFAYSDVAAPDGVTAAFRSLVPNWRDMHGASDADFRQAVARDRIDVLVDCAGHTAGNRLAAFAHRPAPVQFTWLGYPGTTGLDCFDARLVDAIADPPGAADAAASEPLARLAGGFLAYMPAPFAPPVGPLPMLAQGAPTFGSFNNLPKITAACVALWAGVLRAVPAARLLIKARGLGEPALRERLVARFAAEGIAPGRVLAAGFDDAVQDHIARYNAIDVALDTTPYNGTTTTCEALWMGVPVVTSTGTRHAARVGTSLVSHLGRGAWAAGDAAAFAATAADLVADPARLAAIRAGLRNEMAASPLCDGARLARAVEALCFATWRRVVSAA
jgi:predicted O-linked N-acetylglucosamine transferase (SPINDLY family)